MKIQSLLVRAIKGIRNFTIHNADATCVEIAGKNGAGKSTILDAIRFAIGGPKVVDSRLLRQGEEEGEVILETDDGWRLVRKVREGKGPTATITANGEKRGQRDLDGLFGAFSFDPLAFSRMKPAEQIAVLQSLAGPEHMEALAKLDAAIKDAENERLLTGRDLKKMGAIQEVPEVEPVDVADLAARLEAVKTHNRQQEEAARRKADAKRAIVTARNNLEAAQRALDNALQAASVVPEPEELQDEGALHRALLEAGQRNEQAAAHVRYKERLHEWTALNQQSVDLDARVERLRRERTDLARAAALPVEGVTFSGSEVRVNGIPFDQLSSSERIRVSAKIGARADSELRIMIVQDGSLLDDSSWEELKAVAQAEGIQLWVETVGEGHGDALVLEAGELRDPEF